MTRNTYRKFTWKIPTGTHCQQQIQSEDQLTLFDKSLHSLENSLMKKYHGINLNNLTQLQTKLLKYLKVRKDIIIKPTYKTLGQPC
jgi:hypothetical protein